MHGRESNVKELTRQMRECIHMCVWSDSITRKESCLVNQFEVWGKQSDIQVMDLPLLSPVKKINFVLNLFCFFF